VPGITHSSGQKTTLFIYITYFIILRPKTTWGWLRDEARRFACFIIGRKSRVFINLALTGLGVWWHLHIALLSTISKFDNAILMALGRSRQRKKKKHLKLFVLAPRKAFTPLKIISQQTNSNCATAKRRRSTLGLTSEELIYRLSRSVSQRNTGRKSGHGCTKFCRTVT